MRAVALAALLLAGCTGAPATPAAPAATSAPVTPAPATPTSEPTASASATPVANTVRTADDEQIATLIEAGADEAVAQLKLLNGMDPSKLEDLFLPLGEWIASQKAGVEALTASSCTSAAAALFIEGLDRYDAIRKEFLAWRDWGAHGHAFPPGAPREAAATFTEALTELAANCSA